MLNLGPMSVKRELGVPLRGVNILLTVLDRLNDAIVGRCDHAEDGSDLAKLPRMVAVDERARRAEHVIDERIGLDVDFVSAALTVAVRIATLEKLLAEN